MYDSANRRTSLTLPNGVVMSYSYDNASQLSAINYQLGSNSLGNLTYTYDLAGRRTSLGGNLASTGLPQPVSLTAYDAANELTEWGAATPVYDANGNTLSDGTNSYAWNGRNQLASMNSSAESFQYDPLGRRVAKTVLFGTTNYLYDGANPVQELAGTTPTANLLTGLGIDERFTRTDSSATANFLTDALGSTLALTDPSGNTLASYTYEPFGNTTATGSSASTYQFTGRENDGTGVYYYRARYYSPTLQRFMSEDPLGMLGSGPNLYAYVSNSPINGTDPEGTVSPFGPWSHALKPLSGRKDKNSNPNPLQPLSGKTPEPQSQSPCTAARAALASVGSQLSAIGNDLTWTGIAAVGISGAAAIPAPEGAPGELAGAEAGVGLIEVGGASSTLGASLEGDAQSGLAGGIKKAAINVAVDQISSRLTGGLFPGIDSAAKSAAAALLGEIPDLLQNEEAACGGG